MLNNYHLIWEVQLSISFNKVIIVSFRRLTLGFLIKMRRKLEQKKVDSQIVSHTNRKRGRGN